MADTIAARLDEIGRSLPEPSAPVASYIPTRRAGDLVYVSGQISQEKGKPAYQGQLGAMLTVEDGRRAAERAALGVLAQLSALTGGSLASVKQILRLTVFVACTADFTEQPEVANGASDLFVEVFGERGRHTRAAVGVSALPRGVAVEIDAIVELEPERG